MGSFHVEAFNDCVDPVISQLGDELVNCLTSFLDERDLLLLVVERPTETLKFVHISAVEAAGMNTLNDGAKVSFDLETGKNGKVAAANLQKI